MVNDTFRSNFPEFSNSLTYTDSQLDFYGDLAELMLLECRWGIQKPYGVQLFVAHNITLAKVNLDASNNGAVPGGTSGPVASKSVGSASVSYDTNAGLEKDAGHWNMTTYGKQFIHLARMMGAGAYQL